MVARACPVLAFVIASLLPSCSSEFETSRVATARSLGQELYTLVCDRVGAQALREDVTGRSFRSVCHPNGQGAFAERVDVALLPPIDGEARDTDGNDVSLAKRLEQRRVRIARIEALARRRRDLIAAFDSMIPDVALDVPSSELPTTTPGDSSGKTPSAPAASYRLRSELTAALSRIVDLYNDGSVPELTRALAEVLGTVEQSPSLQDALARLDSRQGYRPPAVALGVLRPALAYPRLPELANALLRLVATDSDPFNPKGKLDPTKATLDGNRRPIAGAASGQFQAFLATLHEELRVLESAAPPVALRTSADPVLPNVVHLSRPRSSLEMAKELLLDEASAYGDGPSRLIVGRDPRSVAQVRLVQGLVPAPFVDADGDGLPDLDALDRFKPLAGYSIPTPFVAGSGTSTEPLPVPRDGLGRAVGGSGPVYDYLDTNRTLLASILRDSRRLFDAEGKPGSSTVMGLVGAIPVLSGPRDEVPIAVKVYPNAANDGALAVAPKASRAEKAPASDTVAAADPKTGSQRKLAYRAFHPENSPLSNLIHALGQIAANPAVDDTMALTRALVEKQPQTVARLVGLGLDIKRILDGHPEATLPSKSTFVDEVLEILVKMARVPGVMEDLLRALTTDDVLKLSPTLEAFLDHKDVLSYNRDPNDPANAEKLNGPLLNKTRGLVVDAAKPFGTKVDRSRPDTGENRSAFQRMAQLLHDANGLAACNKAGAVAHVKIRWKGIPVDLDYPSNPLAKTVCAFVGGGAPPDPMPQCGILRFENIDELLLDVALGRAKFAIQDRCLDKIVKNETLTGLVGGANAFLEEISGIRGFSLDPTVGGVARLAFFETPYAPFANSPAFAGDGFYPKSRDFLRDIIDPIPSTVCPLTPFVDRDGKVLNLRSCTHFKDTLRGRDGDALFPLDTMGFIQSIRPFAAAFADHGVPLLFVELFDAVHLHWGSSFQSKDECDPTLPRSHARWCSQDGLSRSEAMLVDVLRSDLFATAQSFAKTLAATSIAHCDEANAVTGECTKTHAVDGIQVVSEMLRVLLDPARTPGLKARDGRTFALRNDGTPTQGLSAAYLFFDALKGIDKAFESWAMAHPGDTDRQANLKAARSQVVDTYLSVKGTGPSAAFENPAIVRALPKVLDTLRAQLSSHCPRDPKHPEAPCVWAAETLPKEVEEWMSGPSYAAAVDLLDVVRKDETARRELERLALYLIDDTAVGGQPSRLTTSLAAAADSLLFLNGASNLTPIYRMMSTAALPIERDAGGRILQRGFVASSVDLLARLYARCVDETGKTRPDMEVDPHRAFGEVLKRMVMPIESRADGQSPAELLVSILSDVNRADPSKTDAFQGADFGNIAKELNEFLLDPAQGLEQVYEVIREATKNL